ncbi:MAG: glycerol-3-phosphate responsive antiterminator [Eubacteriales bacterium]|nr:glycerol-3-phosphate responsive antiterminator [Eubacteriales bacterium]
MNQNFYDLVEANPVIAAVKDEKGLRECCELEDIKVVFILFGDVCSIGDIVDQIKQAGKIAMVHIDLVNGLSGKDIVVDFIKNNTRADGIISTKAAIIKRAKELGLYTIFRVFVIDSIALENIKNQFHVVQPDFIEILPGAMPRIISKICDIIHQPVIAGGLISDKESVIAALEAGAISVSTTNPDIWKM